MIIADPLSMQLRWNAAREKDLTAEAFTWELIDRWIGNWRILDDIISGRNTWFISDIWRFLTAQLGF
jgi:hypothetical protein